MELVREITYWIAISGRANEFVNGMICSEDLLYFIIVSGLFLALSIVRLKSVRQKTPFLATLGKYVGVILIVCVLGYFSSRPALMSYYDATNTKRNTLTENSQKVIAQAKGGLTITTYVNALDENDLWTALPRNVKNDQKRFKQYVRFKPEIKMKYVYYYDTLSSRDLDRRYPTLNSEQRAKKIMDTYGLDSTIYIDSQAIRSQVDLFPEGNKFVRLLERESGEKTFLRVYNDMYHHPFETEITAAIKRMTMKLPKVGFLKGHGERDIQRSADRDYQTFAQEKSFRNSLLNQGFDAEELTLEKEIPSDIDIVVIAEMRDEMTDTEKAYLDNYINKGGNLFILSEPKRSKYMSPLLEKFGVKLVPGSLVEKKMFVKNSLQKRDTFYDTSDAVRSIPTKEGVKLMYQFQQMIAYGMVIGAKSVSGLEYSPDNGYKVTTFLQTPATVWNELETTNFVDDTATVNPKIGEVEKAYSTGLALSRKVPGKDKEQRVIIVGDADCISNSGMSERFSGMRTSNFTLIPAAFYWLSDEEMPIDVRRPLPPDNKVYMSGSGISAWTVVFKWVVPILLAVCSVLIWFRRRGR